MPGTKVNCKAEAKGAEQGLAKDGTGKLRGSQNMEDQDYVRSKTCGLYSRDVIEMF